MTHFMQRWTWAAIRFVYIALAAPHIYPARPPTVSLRTLTSAVKVLAVVLLIAFAALLILTQVWSPYLSPLCADAFALCRW